MVSIWNIKKIMIDRLTKILIDILTKTENLPDCEHCHLYNKDQEDTKKVDIKIEIARLIKESEKYFLYEIESSTIDHILHDHSELLRRLGYSHRIALETFERYGIFMYVNDLRDCIDAPKRAKYRLKTLINIYGLERVTEEIAIYLSKNYPEKFGISILCSK